MFNVRYATLQTILTWTKRIEVPDVKEQRQVQSSRQIPANFDGESGNRKVLVGERFHRLDLKNLNAFHRGKQFC